MKKMIFYQLTRKKRKRIRYNNIYLEQKIPNSKKYYRIIIVFLIIINLFLLIKLFRINSCTYNNNHNNNYNYSHNNNSNNNTIINVENNTYNNISINNNNTNIINNTSIYSPRKRIFIYKEDKIESNNNKNQIHISMAIDKRFIYPTLVSMTSALENNNKEKNIIIYHILFSENISLENIEIFDSLKKDYDVKINYYVIPNIFNKYKTWVGGTYTIYYKILLPLIFYDLERIIYLDADTLIFKDLLEMYNLPFNDNYILGYPFHDVYKIDEFVKDAKYYINGGVLLFNIKKIRNDNKDIELIRFTINNNSKLWFLEQDSINIIFSQKIGFLPLKYGIYMYGNIESFEKSIQIRIRIKLNRTEIIEAINNPSLVHFSGCNPKVWFKSSSNEFGFDEICKRFNREFYYYANKTQYYSDIYKSYN